MQQLDWIILIAVLAFIVIYGIWKTRNVKTANAFLSGNKSPWWMVGLSVMATQASAITFLSTPGQAYNDGLGFVQFYFGLPIAMVLLCIFVLPLYFKMKVYTAYEYLENRFGLPTRILTALLFLIQRGLAAGITIFAPAIVLSTILGLPLQATILIIGVLVIIYTLIGGTEAVSQTQKQQMLVIFIGMAIAFYTIVNQLPLNFNEALHLSGQLGKLEAINFNFNLNNRYNIWSAFLGGTFLFLSYFGTDQSQVQRYLTGKSLRQSQLGLLFNGLFKVPMQFFILLTGVMVFVFFQFNQAPLHFNPIAQEQFAQNQSYQDIEKDYDELFLKKEVNLKNWQEGINSNNKDLQEAAKVNLLSIQQQENELRTDVRNLIKANSSTVEANDKDYVFIYFILNYLPKGIVGLLMAVILSAAMSSSSSELNALATTSVVDIYKRNFAPNCTDKQFLFASRAFTLLWGCIALFFALKASLFENLIQAVNIIGSLFYGVILGVFAVAFLLPKIKGKAVMISILLVEPIVILLYWLDVKEVIELEFLWLNPIGCLLFVAVAWLLQSVFKTN